MIRLIIYIGYYLLNVVMIKDALAFWLTLPMMAFVTYNVSQLRNRYVGVDDMVTFIIFLFFVIEPLQRIDHGHIGTDGPVSPVTFHTHYLVAGAITITLFYAVYTIGIRLLARFRAPPIGITIPSSRVFLLLAIAVAGCIGYILLSGGLGNVLAPRFDKNANDINVLSITMTALQTVATFMLATLVTRFDYRFVVFGAAMMLLILCYNPFNTARFFLIATYAPLLFILLRGRIRILPFYLASFGMIVVVMPILSLTTRFGSLAGGTAANTSRMTSSIFNLPFIDVYDMLVENARYADASGFSGGAKLLGDFLFFVPRAIWTGKPTLNALDIGTALADQKIAGTANLSMFVIGDGYRDFGYPGVVLTTILIIAIIHFLVYRRPKLINGLPLVNFVLVASLPILIRGPISAVVPLFFLQMVSLAILWRVIARRETRVTPQRRTNGAPPIDPRARAVAR